MESPVNAPLPRCRGGCGHPMKFGLGQEEIGWCGDLRCLRACYAALGLPTPPLGACSECGVLLPGAFDRYGYPPLCASCFERSGTRIPWAERARRWVLSFLFGYFSR